MARASKKSMRKFASSGALQKTITARRKHQQARKKIERKGAAGLRAKDKAPRATAEDDGEDEEGDEEEEEGGEGGGRFGGMSVDDFLGGGFVGSGDEEEGDDDEGFDDEDEDDDASFASVDDLDDDEGGAHMHELAKLAEKDPEFYKYLQENDAELLNFNPDAMADAASDDEDAEMGDEEDGKTPVLTHAVLKGWQKSLLENRSLRALRKLLVAFRSAAHMNEDGQVTVWSIESASVYEKLVTTALTYAPVVLAHHVPYKTSPDGKLKPPTQTHKFQTLQRLIASFFHNVLHLVPQLSEPSLIRLAVSESAKLLPYVMNSKRTVKAYLKVCLELWAGGEDGVRIAAFLAVRRLAGAPDAGVLDMILKSTYLQLVRSSKATSVHTLPSINLMKNSAAELFCLDAESAYTHAFGYIRQLAIHLRTSMKMKTKESYKQVYNWQFVHSVDFWALVLARACASSNGGKESPLQPLLFPFAQVATGAVRLLSHARSYPFHLHILRSLVHLTRHTGAYIPLLPFLLPPLAVVLSPTAKAKASSARPLDFETALRAPGAYAGTRVYAEGVADEASFVLAEWLGTRAVHGSIAFPELVVPAVVTLRRSLKAAKEGKGAPGKAAAAVKALVERIEESARWVEERRKAVGFAPGQMDEVVRWEQEVGEKVEEAPLGKYVRVLRKAREKRRRLVEKAREGKEEILED